MFLQKAKITKNMSLLLSRIEIIEEYKKTIFQFGVTFSIMKGQYICGDKSNSHYNLWIKKNMISHIQEV